MNAPESSQTPVYAAFAGTHLMVRGTLTDAGLAAKRSTDLAAKGAEPCPVLLFAEATGDVVELDWRGTETDFMDRLAKFAQAGATAAALNAGQPQASAHAEVSSEGAPRGPGRPRLGVVAREVTLLPRHWDWLAAQPGGASVALRKLVEVALRTSQVKDKVRLASERGYKFMRTMAEHLPAHMTGFDEASRALFAGDQAGFEAATANWPPDVQTQLRRLLSDAFWWF